MKELRKALAERREQKEQLISYVTYIESITKDWIDKKLARHTLIKIELINDIKEINDTLNSLNEANSTATEGSQD